MTVTKQDLRHVVSDAPRVMVVDGSRLVRKLIGDHVDLMLDANMAWTAEEALERAGLHGRAPSIARAACRQNARVSVWWTRARSARRTASMNRA